MEYVSRLAPGKLPTRDVGAIWDNKPLGFAMAGQTFRECPSLCTFDEHIEHTAQVWRMELSYCPIGSLLILHLRKVRVRTGGQTRKSTYKCGGGWELCKYLYFDADNNRERCWSITFPSIESVFPAKKIASAFAAATPAIFPRNSKETQPTRVYVVVYVLLE